MRAGGEIAWYRTGGATGTPVMLLHELGGWAADWRKIAPLLAAERPIIALDLPGHGASLSTEPVPFVQTVPESAARLVAALDELGIERFGLVGNSLGGLIATRIAADFADRVSDLALVAVGLSSGKPRALLNEQEAHPDPAEWTTDWRPLPRSREQTANFATIDPAIDDEQNASRAIADRWVRPSERGAALTDMPAVIARTRCPLLVKVPDVGPYSRYRDVPMKVRAHARVMDMSGAGSFLHQENPVGVAQGLRRFWRDAGIV